MFGILTRLVVLFFGIAGILFALSFLEDSFAGFIKYALIGGGIAVILIFALFCFSYEKGDNAENKNKPENKSKPENK